MRLRHSVGLIHCSAFLFWRSRPSVAIANAILASGLIPAKADRDALHIGVATFHRMHLLLTWNIRHIANAHVREDLRVLIASLGYTLPTICTPEDLLPPS